MNESTSALTSLGFTQVETLLYQELLRASPATAYRLAQQIGKVPANIYRPLSGLVEKGAVFVNEAPDEAPHYVPVPPRQLMKSLGRAFAERQAAALSELEALMEPTNEVVVTQLRSISQVISRAQSMLEAARKVVIFDCMPATYELLRDDLESARARGIEVAGLAYDEEYARMGIPLATSPLGDVEARWPGHGLILVVDGSEQLIALLSRDHTQVISAVYSDSEFLCCILHNTLAADIMLAALRRENPELGKAIDTLSNNTPGHSRMAEMARQIDNRPG